MNLKEVSANATTMYDEITRDGVDRIINLFAEENSLEKKYEFNQGNEYLKRMLLAQMNLMRNATYT